MRTLNLTFYYRTYEEGKTSLQDTIVPAEGDNADPYTEKNAKAFGEMATFLDDRSLSLVLRDARDDGRRTLSKL